MEKVFLQHKAENEDLVSAVFSPSHGMNLLNFSIGDKEFIDQSTKGDFEKRFGGLGPLIGPHFYHREESIIPKLDTKVLPFMNNLSPSQLKDPLSHGIGRYCHWNYTSTSSSIKAEIAGMDTMNGQTLASIEGFDFALLYKCKLTKRGLEIDYSCESVDHTSTIGLHYYLSLPKGDSFVQMDCKDTYNDLGSVKNIPDHWKKNGQMHFPLSEPSDYSFWPNTTNNSGSCILVTPEYSLKISYKASSEEHSLQLYHPKDSSFVCIEPVSAIDPRNPQGNKHKLHVTMELL